MSVLRLASSILALLLLASLSALPAPGNNVLDGADSEGLLIVRAPLAEVPQALADLGPGPARLPALPDPALEQVGTIVPSMGENIPEMGQ